MGVTGGYRWLQVVTGDFRFKVKSSIRDKHTNIVMTTAPLTAPTMKANHEGGDEDDV